MVEGQPVSCRGREWRTGQRVLDVACGTGIVARLLAPQVGPAGHVTGLDFNAGMLSVARAQTPRSGAPVEWREGDAGALPFGDESFDAVLCQQGLQFFPDKLAALREMHRVLAAGGRLGVCVWQSIERNPWSAAVTNALARHVNQNAAEKSLVAYALGNANDLRKLIADAGFRAVEIRADEFLRRMGPPEESVPLSLASSGVVGTIVAALQPDVRAAVVAEITAAVQPYRDEKGLTIPRRTLIALAQK
ncbi:MAG: methyltransferase domain-containing protein [Betaproteobacteria bacterium]|nr:methyltransferase domain-containing protein [Betaproteobacteria bacterium]